MEYQHYKPRGVSLNIKTPGVNRQQQKDSIKHPGYIANGIPAL
jgi:hypothetical protein